MRHALQAFTADRPRGKALSWLESDECIWPLLAGSGHRQEAIWNYELVNGYLGVGKAKCWHGADRCRACNGCRRCESVSVRHAN